MGTSLISPDPYAGTRRRVYVLAFCLVLVFGCGSRTELYPAHGKVYVDGRPAEGAIVVFHSKAESESSVHKPSAVVDAEGSFVLEAEPGDYRVAVVWYNQASQADRVTGAVPIRLDPRYGDPRTSPLKVDIGPSANELPPFQLSRSSLNISNP
jgi:hypothetical protein